MLWTPHGLMGSTGHVVEAVDLDGTNDYANRGADLDMADGTDATMSAWFNIQGGNGSARSIISAVGDRFELKRESSNKIFASFLTAGGAGIWQGQTTATFTDSVNTGWHHVLVAVSLVATPKRHIYVDDVNDQNDVSGPGSGGTIDMTNTDWDVGQRSNNSARFFGFLSEVWFTDTYIDITVAANRRKFITAGLKPVNLGPDGSRPMGFQPSAYFRQAAPNWEVNQGSGGGFTENGTLNAASSSPSD